MFSYHTLRDLPHWWVRAWEGSMGLIGTVCKDRALCFFQVVIVDDEIKTARASLSQIRRAAAALILQCAAGAESRGGIASNIGGDNNLAVLLGTYQPTVQCRGTFGPEWSSCRDILGDIPAGKTPLIFGPRSAPEVQQGLPLYIDS
ncbi:MAG: hypothetical protein Q9175_007774, partial [Cornicularia normoerica]